MLDDEEEEAFVLRMRTCRRKRRQVKWRHERIDWNKHVEMLHHTCGFETRYHMTEPSFNKLVDIRSRDTTPHSGIRDATNGELDFSKQYSRGNESILHS